MRTQPALLIASIQLCGCESGQYLDLTGQVNLQASERHLIEASQPLEATAPFAEVCLLPANSQSITEFAFRTAADERFLPTVTMIGMNGSPVPFGLISRQRTSDNRIWLCFGAFGPYANAPYQALAIYTPVKLELAAVRWQNYEK